MLRDKSLRKVYRCGRRCLPAWVKIINPITGALETVGDLFKQQQADVVALNLDNYTLVKQKSCDVSYNGKKEVFRVTCTDGKTIDATSNHPLLSKNGWETISKLHIGDYIAVPSRLNFFGTLNIKDTDIKYLADTINSKDSVDNFIPKEVFMATKPKVALFVSLLYSKNGWIDINSNHNNDKYNAEIKYTSYSEELIRGISHLLLRFGIKTYIKKKANKIWQLSIYDKDSLIMFDEQIGICGKENEIATLLDNIRLKTDINNSSTFVNNDIEWVQIQSIYSIGVYDTYDFTVPTYHNFIANDIITHNTGKTETMNIEGLHKVFVNKNFRVLYITPYENQVNLIFMRFREIINDSPLIKKEVVRIKNNPYMIEFKNGSVIMGFTTGASSGSGGASVRGQRADWLMLDELDYMAENDYSTVAMIAGERSDIGITASSTPIGKRGTFYSMCTDPSWGYSEHYHPSPHNPNWNQEMEDQFRAELTQSQYDHEILAIFGTEETGVFDKNKVDKATTIQYYTYDKLTDMQLREIEAKGANYPDELIYDEHNLPPYNPFLTIGVDFDKFQASSSIIVLAYDVNIQKFKVIKRIEVPRGEYTLDNAVKMVIQVNKIYRPSWIYIDRGYGKK